MEIQKLRVNIITQWKYIRYKLKNLNLNLRSDTK